MKFIRINEKDDVAVALEDLNIGETVPIGSMSVALKENIKKGHKFAIKGKKAGEDVLKYGFSIGHASQDIEPGQWVHVHNLKTNLDRALEYRFNDTLTRLNPFVTKEGTFFGYQRKDGKVGIRNEIWIINTVGCINKFCDHLVQKVRNEIDLEGTDGIYTFNHPFGCSQLSDDLKNTQKLLKGLVNHPNAAGVLVVGLGCENNHLEEFKKVLGNYDKVRVKFVEAQESQDEEAESLEKIKELITYARDFKREEVPISALKIGLKCGGSDGFSGITANPLVGQISDEIVSFGGTSILTEVPEMFGAETIFMDRAENIEVFDKIVGLINDFKDYFIKQNQVVYENPSPGNKEGGITTLEDKSLGCTQKGGSSIVRDVLSYGEETVKKGLNLIESPGNDLVSVSALVAAGAHIVLFTTGRGTPFGGAVPTIKIATNTNIYERKKNWFDFNAGILAEGKPLEEVKKEFWDYILSIANGVKTQNEIRGFKEIAIFKNGVTL